MRISKSKFVAGVQCLKRLYLLVHEPETAQPDIRSQAVIEQGHQVGSLARKMFSGGVEVGHKDDLDQAIRTTRELVANREIPAIFEGAFEHGGVLVRVDILQRRRDRRWRLIEVKSTADIRDHHLDDVAIQQRVVSRSGVDLESVCLAHVNRGYVYEGGSIDVRRFFKMRNLTRRIAKMQSKLASQLRSEFRTLAKPEEPDITPGRQCGDPVICEFFTRCNLPRPEDHIGFLPRIHARAMDKLENLGVQSIYDIPEDFELSEIQRRAAACVRSGKPWYAPELCDVLSGLIYPLYFADFETLYPAIPRFPGMRPFDHLPFQWSVHVQRTPGAAPEHLEFLAMDGNDPRREFAASLSDALGESGSIIVYSSFESRRLAELGTWLPQFADRIKAIQARLFDLLRIVREHVYYPAFAGSFSLKTVLPALVPGMTYAGMEVANGQGAGLAWESLVRGDLEGGERDRIRRALLDYCGQDTLALVRLTNALRAVQNC